MLRQEYAYEILQNFLFNLLKSKDANSELTSVQLFKSCRLPFIL